MLLFYGEAQYKLLLYIAGLAPELTVTQLSAEPLSGGQYRVTALIKNDGWLSTYVTKRAVAIRKDYPVVVNLTLDGAEIEEGNPVQTIGHILGKYAYIGEWSGSSEWGRGKGTLDLSVKKIEWTVRKTGSGSFSATVNAWGYKSGSDTKTVTITH